MESLNRIQTVEKFKEQKISNKLLKDIAQMLKENNAMLNENNDLLKRKEKLLMEIKDEVRKIKFNTQ